MKIPVWICSLLLAAAIAVEGWCLHEIISLKVSVAELSYRIGRSGATNQTIPEASPQMALRAGKNHK
jgi:hypothetical protein